VTELPIDPVQRQLAERRLLAALRRHARRQPLRPHLRVDSLIADLRATEPTSGAGHRGRQPLLLDDGELRTVVDLMADSGILSRDGRLIRLPDAAPALDPVMRGRVDRLLEGIAEAGAMPPPIDGIASRLGIPAGVIAELRAAGELVSLGAGIDYPMASWERIRLRLDRLARHERLSAPRVRDELRTTRRHAEAILRRWKRGRS
jgi:hypothetical protein